jgi:hypothetical protein
MQWFQKRLPVPILLALLLAAGCNRTKEPEVMVPNPTGPGGGWAPSPLRLAMMKMMKGPQALNAAIRTELMKDAPAWDDLGTKTTEFADLAGQLGKHTPARGSQESWTELTTAFAASAGELDKAVQARDKEAALAAHKKIGGSCMACHREHQMRGGPPAPPGGSPPRPGGGAGFGPPGSAPTTR